jgi:hypothetical protein
MPMFGFISWLLSNPDTSYYFSKQHHAGACCIAFVSIVVIAAILFSSISKLCQTLLQMKETRRGLAGIILSWDNRCIVVMGQRRLCADKITTCAGFSSEAADDVRSRPCRAHLDV